MASFSAGANAFLNSQHKVLSVGPNPVTERGVASVINFHPKEPRIIYASGKFIVVKSIVDPNDCFIYRGHSATTTVAKFSPNGYWVCSADVTGKVRVWSWDNPEHLTKLESQVFAGSVLDIDWDFESKKIVAVGEGAGMMAKVFVWDTGNSAGEMVGHNKRITSVSFKPNRPFRIMTGSEDMRTIFYSGPPFKLDHSNPTHTNFVNAVRFSPDGNHIISVGSDKKIQVYAGATGQPTAEIPNAHQGTIYSVAFSPDSTKFATASADKTVKIWNIATMALENTLVVSDDAQIGDMQVSVVWNAAGLVTLSLNGNLNVFDASGAVSNPTRVIQGHQVAITAMAYDRQRGLLYSGSYDGVVIARNVNTGEVIKVKGSDKRHVAGAAHNGRVSGLAIHGDQVVSVGWDDTIRFASVSSHAYNDSASLNGQPVASASSASDLTVVVSNNEIAIFQGKTKVGATGGLGYTPTCVSVLNDSEISVGGSDNKVHVYSMDSSFVLTCASTIETRYPPSALAYSPNGEALAVGDANRVIEVHHRDGWAPLIKGKWVFHTSKITCLSWSPNGKYLASGSLDENIFIWNFEDHMDKVNIPFAHMSGVSGVDWIDNNRLVSVGNDHCVVTWNVASLH